MPIPPADTVATLRRKARIFSIALIAGPAAFAAIALTQRAHGASDDTSLVLPITLGCAALAVVSNALGARLRHTPGVGVERARAGMRLHIAALALPESGAFLALVFGMRSAGTELLLAAGICGVAMIAEAIRGELFFSELEAETAARDDDAASAER